MYTVLVVNSWSWHGEIERDGLNSCSLVMVELSRRKIEIRGGRGNQHEKLGLMRNLCASQFTISDTAGKCPDLARNNTDTRSSKPNQVSYTIDFTYLLVSSILFSVASPISLFLFYHSTIIARTQSQVIPLYLSMQWSWVNTECRTHQVHHTPSAAYTKYSICLRLSVIPSFSRLWVDC